MASYKTNNKKIIFNYLSNNKGESFSALLLRNNLKKENANMGLSTIYRILNELFEDNIIIKSIDENNEAFYSYLDEECHNHLHAKCNNCGKIIHIDEKIEALINDKYNFILSFNKLLLNGKCKNCKEKKI